MRTATLALPILLGMGACSSAMAQEAQVQLPQMEHQREIHTRLGVVAEHHTNIAQTDFATALARGITPEDTTVRPMIELDAFQPFGRNALFLRGEAGYLFHKHNTKLDSRTIDVSGGAVSTLQFCQAAVTGAYNVSQSDLGELAGPVVKNLRTTDSVGAAVNCGRPNGLGGSLSAQRAWIHNSAELARDTNSTTDSLNAAALYKNKGLGEIQLQAGYVESNYPKRRLLPLSAMGFGETIIIRTAGVNYKKTIGAKLKFEGGVARTRLKRGAPPPGVDPKFTATTYTGDLDYKLTPRTDIEIKGERSIKPSNTVGLVYDKETDSEILFHHKVGARFNVTLGARREDVASNTDGSTIFQIYTKYRKDAVYGSIRYDRARLGSITLEVRQENRNTDKPAYDYRDTRVELSIDAQF
jgi:hypothetical protein